jgi:hypothetical protein
MEIQVRISGSCDHEDDDWTVKYWRKTPNRDFRLPSLEAWLQKYEEYETHNDWIYEERKANRYFDFPRSLLTAGGRGQGAGGRGYVMALRNYFDIWPKLQDLVGPQGRFVAVPTRIYDHMGLEVGFYYPRSLSCDRRLEIMVFKDEGEPTGWATGSLTGRILPISMTLTLTLTHGYMSTSLS